MERVDVVVLLLFSVGVSYVFGWTVAIAAFVPEKCEPGVRVWLWSVGLVGAAAFVAWAASTMGL